MLIVRFIYPPLTNYGAVLGEGSWEFRDKALARLPNEVAGSLQERECRRETYFEGLVLQSDGTFLLVYRTVPEESSPIQGANIEPKLAHQILVWNDAAVRNSPVTHEEERAERVLFTSKNGLPPDEDFSSLYGIPVVSRMWWTLQEQKREHYKIVSLHFQRNGTFALTYRVSRCNGHAWSKYDTCRISIEADGAFALLDWFASKQRVAERADAVARALREAQLDDASIAKKRALLLKEKGLA